MLAAWTSTTTSPGPAVGSGASPRRSSSGPPCFGNNNTAFIVSSRLLPPSKKLDQQLAHPLRLLLLHPMAGAIDQMTAQHPGAHALLHPFKIAGTLVGPPIAFSCNEDRGDVDGPAREQLQFSGIDASGAAPVPLQAALEPGTLIFASVDGELALRQPPACCDLRRGWHLGRNGLRHVF